MYIYIKRNEILTIAHLEEHVDPLPDHLPVDVWIGEFSHKPVNRRYNVAHLVPGDATVAVNVVQREGPSQFLIHGAAGQHAQAPYEVLQQ